MVNGELFAKNGISFMTSSMSDAEDKIKRFETDTDVVDEVEDILE